MIEFAAAVVAAITPSAIKAGEKIAGKAGEALWEAVKGKLTQAGKGQELATFEKKGGDPDRQVAFKMTLADFLEDNPQAVAELRTLLDAARAAGAPSVSQTITSTGNGNVNIQVAGSGNTIQR